MTLVPFPKGMETIYRPVEPRTGRGLLAIVLVSLAVLLGLWLVFVAAITFGAMSLVPQ